MSAWISEHDVFRLMPVHGAVPKVSINWAAIVEMSFRPKSVPNRKCTRLHLCLDFDAIHECAVYSMT